MSLFIVLYMSIVYSSMSKVLCLIVYSSMSIGGQIFIPPPGKNFSLSPYLILFDSTQNILCCAHRVIKQEGLDQWIVETEFE